MRLFRFPTSNMCLKVQCLLELAGASFELVDIPYADRSSLLALTGGYAAVPVLQLDDGRVVCDSRRICQTLIDEDPRFARFVPAPLEGPVWAYADWADNLLEDVAFRWVIGALCARRTNANDRALFIINKERRFGAGCIEQWERQSDELQTRLEALLAPTLKTLRSQPFVFGQAPTLADAALYGECAMIALDRARLSRLGTDLRAWMDRMGALGATLPAPA